MNRQGEFPPLPVPGQDLGLYLDQEAAARKKAERNRHFMTRTVPKLRFIGVGLEVALLLVYNYFFMGRQVWSTVLLLFSASMTNALLSWGLLTFFYQHTWKGFSIFDLSLVLDIFPVSLLVYLTGAEQSFLFPLFLTIMGGQAHTTFRRATFFTNLVTLAFLGTIAYAAWGAGHQVTWGREITKAFLIYGTGFYISMITLEAERLRKRVHDSIEITRDFNRRLVSQAAELVSKAEELRLARDEAEVAKQSAETASQTKSAFLASTSHDLRTPLNAILLYSELMREDAEAEGRADAVEDLKKIHGAGKHLLQLLNDLLDLAKVEAGKMTFYLEELSVPVLVAEIQDFAVPLVAQKKNRLLLEVDPALHTLVADATRLKQILLNLLSNAAKFTEGGDITLSMGTEVREGRDWFRAEVRDTGLGMSPDQLGLLFQEFVQAEDSTTKKFGGTGLGLVLCQRLSALMGGDIQVASALGQGSTFTVRLPWQRQLARAPGEADAVTMPVSLPGQLGKKVLIIDDDESIREALRRVFSQEGFEVLEAATGEAGLDLARAAQPTLITLDVVMPGIDGWTVLRTLKSTPELAGIPVILITLADDRSQGFALGASEYLPKPIDPRKFQEVLRRLAPEAGALLLVEDDEAQRVAMRRVLEGAGWHVQEAGHGLEALRILDGGLVPDLILLDLKMPQMDGFEFMDVFHQRHLAQQIPVVVITSEDPGEEARTRLTQRGVRQVLPKSAYPKEKLVKIVRDLALHFPKEASRS